MRRRPLRDLDAGAWTDLLLVAAVTSILGIRAYLELTGYPKIGGESLHIAHMLWGGLLMLVALWMLLFHVGRRVRPVAAIVGGLGFGTFIDEVGKFVTHDHDYFFEPAVAIIYATLLTGYVVARLLEQRWRPAPADHLATALRDLEESLLEDLDEKEKRRILERLDGADPSHPLTRAVRAFVEDVDLVDGGSPPALARLSRWTIARYRSVARSPWFVRGTIAFFVLQLGVKLAFAGRLATRAWQGVESPFSVLPDSIAAWGLAISSTLSALFVAAGIRALLANSRARALHRFQASILVTLLVGQVFQFHLEQWSALTGLGLQLVLFVALRYAIDHERDVAEDSERGMTSRGHGE